jgi:hypothetical protein
LVLHGWLRLAALFFLSVDFVDEGIFDEVGDLGHVTTPAHRRKTLMASRSPT